MSDYGAIFNSPLFPTLFPDFQKLQGKAASAIWTRILGRCGIDIGMPTIDVIIDLGCGDGTLTAALANNAAQTQKGLTHAVPIRVIGIDCSKSAIAMAKEKAAGINNCEFLHSQDDFLSLFQKLKLYRVDWKRTALVCLSHTWFHLEQTQLLSAIKLFRPALLLIDVFHSWDLVVEKLSGNAVSEELEFGRYDNNATYWLRTTKQGAPDEMVCRGIWKPASTQGEWVFPPTDQHRISTKQLFGTPIDENVEGIFEASRKQGSITGEDGCDYIQRKLVRHPSGWGEMLCYALVPRDREATRVNYIYFEVVRRIVRDLFIGKPAAGLPSKLSKSLALYDEPEEWKKKKGLDGSREALIVLPFDPHTNFARVVSLFMDADDSEISKHDLIVEMPKNIQVRFPTAYGIFHTLEDKVSSPQGFPLHWAQDYEHAPVDKAFEELETALLGIWDKHDSESSISFEDGRAPSYFLLPIYFGSLPLFALALKFPQLFATESTNFQVYLSALTALHAQIKVALSDAYIRENLLRPWITGAMDALSDERPLGVSAYKPLEAKLEALAELLFGLQITPEEVNRDSNKESVFWVAGTPRIGGVMGKDWKSWLLSIPSFPIRNLHVVEAENTRLWEIWQEERERALLTHELRISLWFQEADFFGGEGHDSWVCSIHKNKLARMLSCAGVASWDGLCGNALTQCYYLARSADSYLLPWACNLLRKLQLQSSNCPSFNGREKCTSECKNASLYQDLKSVFCKQRANHGRGMRFSWRRFTNIINAAIDKHDPVRTIQRGDKLTLSEKWGERLDNKFCCDDDPTLAVGDIAEWFAKAKILEKVDFPKDRFVLDIQSSSGCGVAVLHLKTIHGCIGLSKACGGHDLRQLQEAFFRAGIDGRTFDSKVFGCSALFLKLSLNVSSDGQSLFVKTEIL